jgi:hypothetical protein
MKFHIDLKGPNMGDASGDLLIVIIGSLFSMFIFKWSTEDYGNFKKKAIIKSELNDAINHLHEDIPNEKIPIEKGTKFLSVSADSLFGSREYEISNIYKNIERLNNEIMDLDRDMRITKRQSLMNIIIGISNQKWMKELPFIGSRREYIKYTIFIKCFDLKSWIIALKNKSRLKFRKFMKSHRR